MLSTRSTWKEITVSSRAHPEHANQSKKTGNSVQTTEANTPDISSPDRKSQGRNSEDPHDASSSSSEEDRMTSEED